MKKTIFALIATSMMASATPAMAEVGDIFEGKNADSKVYAIKHVPNKNTVVIKLINLETQKARKARVRYNDKGEVIFNSARSGKLKRFAAEQARPIIEEATAVDPVSTIQTVSMGGKTMRYDSSRHNLAIDKDGNLVTIRKGAGLSESLRALGHIK